MPKTIRWDNQRVTIGPSINSHHLARIIHKKDEPMRHAFLMSECERISREVRRHIDDIDTPDVECDTLFECSYCGTPWTEDSGTYNGGCCAADEDNDPENTD